MHTSSTTRRCRVYPTTTEFAYRVLRGKGIQQQQDGFTYKNLLASYTHLRNTASNPWVKQFLQHVQSNKTSTPLDFASAL